MISTSIINIKTDWYYILNNFDYSILDNYFYKLKDQKIYPDYNNIFKCFNYFNFNDLKVVILGEDPCKNDEANGLCFNIINNNKFKNNSLKNIIKEVNRSFNSNINKINIEKWALQGVLLLNNSLTISDNKKHISIWNEFIIYIINYISTNNVNIVFMLWGKKSFERELFIDNINNCILKSYHPSPINSKYKFIGNNHFVLCNLYLTKSKKNKIYWI